MHAKYSTSYIILHVLLLTNDHLTKTCNSSTIYLNWTQKICFTAWNGIRQKLHSQKTVFIVKAVHSSRPSQDSRNSRIWPTTANSRVLLRNAANFTTFSHWRLNNSLDYKIQHRNVQHSMVWGGHSGQDWTVHLSPSDKLKPTTRAAESCLACYDDSVTQAHDTALICLSVLTTVVPRDKFASILTSYMTIIPVLRLKTYWQVLLLKAKTVS